MPVGENVAALIWVALCSAFKTKSDKENTDDMGRRRRRNRRHKNRRDNNTEKKKEGHKKKPTYKQHFYATLFFTEGVRDVYNP